MVRKQVVVRGVVQGVGFRYYTQTEARRLGLAGHVRNRGDGAVAARPAVGPGRGGRGHHDSAARRDRVPDRLLSGTAG